MEWLGTIFAVLVLFLLTAERMRARHDIARVDRKLNAVLKHLNFSVAEAFSMSERVQEAARDPGRKIEAIKLYREESGASLLEAKENIEAFIDSINQ